MNGINIVKNLTPFGLLSNKNIFGITLREAVIEHGLVLIRDHTIRSKSDFLDYAKTLGQCLEWEFGAINELKVDNAKQNYLYTQEAVPFHWDGAFKVSPSFLLFHCLRAPEKNTGGETLFTDTSKLYDNLSEEEQMCFESIELTYQTEKIVHYGGSVTTSLVTHHPHSNKTTLRYAEPVLTEQNPVSLKVKGLSHETDAHFIKKMRKYIYDKQCCYTHQWQENDLIIADNHALIHGRHAFKESSARHIRRIQIL